MMTYEEVQAFINSIKPELNGINLPQIEVPTMSKFTYSDISYSQPYFTTWTSTTSSAYIQPTWQTSYISEWCGVATPFITEETEPEEYVCPLCNKHFLFHGDPCFHEGCSCKLVKVSEFFE